MKANEKEAEKGLDVFRKTVPIWIQNKRTQTLRMTITIKNKANDDDVL